MANPTQEDVLWVNTSGGAPTLTADMSQPQSSVPKPIASYRSYCFDLAWSGGPNGTLDLQVAQAPNNNDTMAPLASGAPIWISVTYAFLVLSNASPATPGSATTPSSQGEANNSHQWARVVWSPTSGGSAASSGALRASFGGITKK